MIRKAKRIVQWTAQSLPRDIRPSFDLKQLFAINYRHEATDTRKPTGVDLSRGGLGWTCRRHMDAGDPFCTGSAAMAGARPHALCNLSAGSLAACACRTCRSSIFGGGDRRQFPHHPAVGMAARAMAAAGSRLATWGAHGPTGALHRLVHHFQPAWWWRCAARDRDHAGQSPAATAAAAHLPLVDVGV